MNYPQRIGSEGEFYFKNQEGIESEKFFYADEYKDGFALIKKFEDGNFQFRDVNGNLSEEYFEAYPYQFGNALIRKTKTSVYNFIDLYGNKSEDFHFASLYKDGYSLVKRVKNGEELLRDVFGRISKEPTEIGDYGYKYMKGEIQKKDIPRSLFFDESFRLSILSEEVRRNKLQNN